MAVIERIAVRLGLAEDVQRKRGFYEHWLSLSETLTARFQQALKTETHDSPLAEWMREVLDAQHEQQVMLKQKIASLSR